MIELWTVYFHVSTCDGLSSTACFSIDGNAKQESCLFLLLFSELYSQAY